MFYTLVIYLVFERFRVGQPTTRLICFRWFTGTNITVLYDVRK